MILAFIEVIDLQTNLSRQRVNFDNLHQAQIQLDNTPGQVEKAEARFEYKLYRVDTSNDVYLRSVYTKVYHGESSAM